MPSWQHGLAVPASTVSAWRGATGGPRRRGAPPEGLPRAASAIRSRGLQVPMITTELTSAADPSARPILSTAARLKIPYFKLGYWKYNTDPVADVRKAAADV